MTIGEKLELGIVKIENNELRVGTWDLSKGFDMEHRALKNLIHRYKSEFEELGEIIFNTFQQDSTNICYISNVTNKGKKRGREVEEFKINQEQYVYLGTLLTNSDKSRKFKLGLTKEFFRMRNILIEQAIQRQNEEWHIKREQSKKSRFIETDSIKKFIEYAALQGSQHPDKYYMIFTKLAYDSILAQYRGKNKVYNIREVATYADLSALEMCELVISTSLEEFMKTEKFYKEAFAFVKKEVEHLSCSIGRTPLRLMEELAEYK